MSGKGGQKFTARLARARGGGDGYHKNAQIQWLGILIFRKEILLGYPSSPISVPGTDVNRGPQEAWRGMETSQGLQTRHSGADMSRVDRHCFVTLVSWRPKG